MAKNSSKDGSGLFLSYIVFIIIGAIITFTSNALNYSTILSYGINQYISNIWHGHHDYYCVTLSKIKVFENIIPAKAIKSHDYVVALDKSKRFKFKGYIAKENITWIAIEIYKKNKRINGYFVLPKKISSSQFWTDMPFKEDQSFRKKYFGYFKDETAKKIKNNLLLVWKKDCLKKFPIKKATDPIEIQELRDSEEHRIVSYISNDNVVYYTDSKSYIQVEKFYNMYLGKNFDTYILQVSNKYNPEKDGVYESSFVEKVISKWYFKFGFPVFTLLVLVLVLSALFSEKIKCPKCESSDVLEGEGKRIGKTYKHVRKDGKKDLRYKDNPEVIKYKRSISCNECSHRWTVTYNQVQN